MRKRINKKILLRFIAPYLLIVLIVFAIQYISNSFVLSALKNNVMEIIETSFKNDIDVIEQNIGNVKETASIVAQNTALRFGRVKREDKDYYSQLLDVKDELSSYYTGGSIIHDICIQYDNTDYLVNFSTAYSKRLYYYQTTVSSPDKTPEELLSLSEKANGFSVENICYYPGELKTIPFVYPIPLLKQRTGSVWVYISEKSLLLPINDLLEKSKGMLKVVNESGQVVSLTGNKDIKTEDLNITETLKKINIDNSAYYVVKDQGKASKWEYIVLLPENYVLNRVQNYQMVSIIFNFLILILGFGICLFFTIRKSRSYAGLLDVLEIKPEIKGIKGFVLKDEYSGLSQHISKIKNENTALIEKGTQNVLRRILNGQLDKTEEIVKELKNHKIELSGPLFGVINIRYSTANAPEKIVRNSDSLLLGKICEIITDARVCFMEKNTAVVLFSCDNNSYRQFVKESSENIEKELFSKYHLSSIIGAGNPVEEINSLSVSYRQACEVVNYKFLTDKRDVLFYDSLPEDDDYFYPLETENAFFKSVRESNYENARDVLREIYEENFLKRSLSVSAINELLAELRASIKKICRMQTEYLEFSHRESSVNHFFENATGFIYMVCSDNEEHESQSRGQKICHEAKNYIELYYSNPNLSLDVIAEEFRIHPNYLSNLFKKHMGNNIISYLESVRIEKATELLSSGKYTVNEVLVSVGFANDSTFRRSFKKIKGVSPSSYLKY